MTWERLLLQETGAPGLMNGKQAEQFAQFLAGTGSIHAMAGQFCVRPAVIRFLRRYPELFGEGNLGSVAASLDTIAPDHWPRTPAARDGWLTAWRDLRGAGADAVALHFGISILARQSFGSFCCMTPTDTARRLALPLRCLLVRFAEIASLGEYEGGLASKALHKLRRLSARGVIEFHDTLAKATRDRFDSLLVQHGVKTGGFAATSLFPRRVGGLDLVPLSTSAALESAAKGLNNCLAGYRFELVNGDSVLLAVRQREQWVAAIHIVVFERPPYAVAFEARGPENQPVPAVIAKLAHALAASVGEASASAFSTQSRKEAARHALDVLARHAQIRAMAQLIR